MDKKSPMVYFGYKKIPKCNFKKYNCDVCDYHTSNKKDFLKHCGTKKHDTKWIHQNSGKFKYFRCNDCDHITASENDFVDHLNVPEQQAIILSGAAVRRLIQRQHLSQYLGPLRQSRPKRRPLEHWYIGPPLLQPSLKYLQDRWHPKKHR